MLDEALTPQERNDLLSKIDAMATRAADHDRREQGLLRQIEELDEDVAAGKPGAKSKALKLAEAAREAQIEAAACRRAEKAAQQRWKDDEPFRDAEKAAERKKLRLAANEVSIDKAKAVDAKARAFVAAIIEHQESLKAPVEFGADQHLLAQLSPQYWFKYALHAAGAKGFDQTLQANPGGPNTLEEWTCEFLRL